MDLMPLLSQMIRCKSVTPSDDGVVDLITSYLTNLGFECYALEFAGDGEAPVRNLYASLGNGKRNFCFAGHVDVVTPGDLQNWHHDPFELTHLDGTVCGRGVVDMKGAIACFLHALTDFVRTQYQTSDHKISLLISGNEEGTPTNGTPKMLKWLASHGHKIDHCLVGEPTSQSGNRIVKIGRRGSFNAVIEVIGQMGHVAYPAQAHNPITDLIALLHLLKGSDLDASRASHHFQPSNLEITNLDVHNEFSNVIPGSARASINIRFNDAHTISSLDAWLAQQINALGIKANLSVLPSSESFLCKDQFLSQLLSDAILEVEGVRPRLSTDGGTSDARFIKNVCPVIEYGLENDTAHKANEHCSLRDLHQLSAVYRRVLALYFERC